MGCTSLLPETRVLGENLSMRPRNTEPPYCSQAVWGIAGHLGVEEKLPTASPGPLVG